MDVLRSNYSTLGPFGQNEAPSAPEAPFTDIMAAYRSAFQEAYYDISTTKQEEQKLNDDNDNDSYRFNKRSSTYSSQEGCMNRKSTSTSKTTNDQAKKAWHFYYPTIGINIGINYYPTALLGQELHL